MGRLSFKFASIVVILNLIVLTWAQDDGPFNASVRRVAANGINLGLSGKGTSMPTSVCPTSLFQFLSSSDAGPIISLLSQLLGLGSSSMHASTLKSFTPLIAGHSFTRSIRVCRFEVTYEGQYVYGVEEVRGNQVMCKALTSPAAVAPTPPPEDDDYDNTITITTFQANSIPRSKKYSSIYQILNIPTSLNVIWVNQRSFPRFPALSPAPLSFQTEQGSTLYLARCNIAVDVNYDPSYTIRIPTFVSFSSFRNSLEVSHNGVNYQCDSEHLEFPVCVGSDAQTTSLKSGLYQGSFVPTR